MVIRSHLKMTRKPLYNVGTRGQVRLWRNAARRQGNDVPVPLVCVGLGPGERLGVDSTRVSDLEAPDIILDNDRSRNRRVSYPSKVEIIPPRRQLMLPLMMLMVAVVVVVTFSATVNVCSILIVGGL